MFEDGKPSTHELAGRAKLLGHPDHRAIARQAARESLVLLKNNDILPLDGKKNILVTGSGADSAAMQSGGWTVTWQGRDLETRVINPPEYYKGHTTIMSGIASAVKDAGGKIASLEGANPDVAIVVFGEDPYAEFEGDLTVTDFDVASNKDFKEMQALKEQGIPVVAVMLTGRPRGVDQIIELSDAFVAAWLPGSEGGGAIADVLISSGESPHDFKGRLPFDWPASGQTETEAAPIRFKRGYGLTY